MHAKVFRERRFLGGGGLFREGPEGVEGRMEGGWGGEQRMQEDADVFICMFVSKAFLSGCVCMFCQCFCVEEGRKDGGGSLQKNQTRN